MVLKLDYEGTNPLVITVQADDVFVDPFGMDGPRRLKEAWGFLVKRSKPSHLSPNFMESVTNHISWYKHSDPQIRLEYENQKVSAISLLDPKGERFRIPID